jgi:DNA polymerase-3 subunit alpha
MALDFCHLHVHSEMSLLDGMSRLEELPAFARAEGMRHLALTDHGVLYGAVDFWKACREAEVHPVLGVEAYLAPTSRRAREGRPGESAYHLLLLAEDDRGFRNLSRLVSLAFLEGFYYRPRLDRELLERHHEGLIATTGCLSAEIPSLVRSGRTEEAERAFRWYLDLFGRERFYVEIMDHGLPAEREVGRVLLAWAARYGVSAIVTQDAHYLRPEDWEAHDVLLAVQTGKSLRDPNRLRYEPRGAYALLPPEEMYRRFAGYEAALRQTVAVAERCSVTMRFGEVRLPAFPLPPGESAQDRLERLCAERLGGRYPRPDEAVRRRLEHELGVIRAMGFAPYFLIVADFVDEARRRGIAVGPGRGSAAGSLVAYVLGITDVDPLRYGLLFERFLNPERVTMPDMDIDFEYERRGEVIDYVTRRYGADRVSQIITFGTMAARAALRDVARAFDVPYAESDRLAKLVPAELGITLERAL